MQHKFSSYINQALCKKSKNTDVARIFLGNSESRCRYIIGKNNQSLDLMKAVKINGIIDDFSEDRSDWNGVPVVYSREIDRNSMVANCSTSISPVNVDLMLRKKEIEDTVSIYDFISISKDIFTSRFFLQDQRDDYLNFKSEWESLFDELSDNISRKTLIDIIRYKITCNHDYMKSYTVRTEEQYFEKFVNLDLDHVFVDAGGFDGETTRTFCSICNNYKKVYFYEPSKENIKKAKERLSIFCNIKYIEKGLSKNPGVSRFSSNAGSASSICKNGDSTINTTTLDIDIKEPVSFIKFDIEGHELNALSGSIKHIKNESPVIAIAAYHNVSDLREIKKFICGINNCYKIYLRHYTQGWSESILYFIPN